MDGSTLICGGMGADPTVDGQTIYSLSTSGFNTEFAKIKQMAVEETPKPFMIGSVAMYHEGSVIIAGGGATCFSMGTFWDTGIYEASVPTSLQHIVPKRAEREASNARVRFISSHRVVSSTSAQKGDLSKLGRSDAKARISTIPRVRLSSASEFKEIVRLGHPVVIENLDLGICLKEWTVQYMTERVGSNKQVSRLKYSKELSQMSLTGILGCYSRMPRKRWQDGF